MRVQVQMTFDAADPEEGSALVKSLLDAMAARRPKAGPVRAVDTPAGLTHVYTDGGCDLRKGGIGAWAHIIRFPDGSVEEGCGVMIGTTNNRMEMMAVIRALERLEFGPPVKVVTDSEYVAKGVTVWSRNWVRNGWKTYDGKPVVNRDLWEPLLQLYQLHDCTFKVVKGHSGHAQNEYVDKMCTSAMINAHKAMLAGEDLDVDHGCVQRTAS